MELVLVLALVAVAALVVVAPLRPDRVRREDAVQSAEHAELAAERDAKYREIRDAELDYRTGKLAEADWRVQDRTLRGQAVEILRRLDGVEGRQDGA